MRVCHFLCRYADASLTKRPRTCVFGSCFLLSLKPGKGEQSRIASGLGNVVVASASGGRRGPVSLSFTVPAYRGPPAPTPAPTATTTTVTTRPHYYEDDRVEI